MTREERTKLIRHLKYSRSISANYLITDKDADEIIKVLEQEPCEDAISRQAVFEFLKGFEILHNHDELRSNLIYGIMNLPPVTPQPKIGHWIEERNDYGEITHWHCSNCYDDSGFITTCKWDFCPNCGAKMVEPQESEE